MKDVEKLKTEISTLLHSQPRRIVVMIDDIDRLTSEEIRQVFRAVKSVGDFPNVTYLLSLRQTGCRGQLARRAAGRIG